MSTSGRINLCCGHLACQRAAVEAVESALTEAREQLSRLRGTHGALVEVADERRRQDEKWGEPNHDPAVWLAILTEEVGELAEAILFAHSGGDERNRTHSADMRTEAIQIAAVAVQFVDYLDRAVLADATPAVQAARDVPVNSAGGTWPQTKRNTQVGDGSVPSRFPPSESDDTKGGE